MGSVHQLRVITLNRVVGASGALLRVKTCRYWPPGAIFSKRKCKYNWSSQGILGWDWGGALNGYGLIAWCDEPYVILYYYDVFFCHHSPLLLSTLQLASLRGFKFMNLIKGTLRALVYRRVYCVYIWKFHPSSSTLHRVSPTDYYR